MRLENPVRLGGLAALAAGMLLLISQLLSGLSLGFLPFGLSGGELAIYGFLGIDGYLGVLLVVLLQLGLVGLYIAQVRAIGILGSIGFFIALVGISWAMGTSFIDPIFIRPSKWPSEVGPPGFWSGLVVFGLTFVLGWVLLGVATLRARLYPWLPIALLIAGSLIFILPLPFSGTIFAVAVAWMGYILFMGQVGEDLVVRVENPVQWGGLIVLLASLLLLISQLLRLYLDYVNPGAAQGIFPIDPGLGVLLGVLMQIGLVGMYAPQAKAAGILGVVGFSIAFMGVWLTMGSSFIFPFIKPYAWPSGEPEEFWAPLAIFGLTFVLGWVLFAVATFRAGRYSREVTLFLLVGALILLLPLPFSDFIFTVALAWVGYTLLTRRGEEELERISV
jgi:hypothetical protein